ncbi:DgyrCDS8611 [Dimorphilus gyrociliatus]|uniref:DgyrCDS8611 n=1 Tax=Dimorphilus gyrociliatus TaxID=2664684 RepID=A0A7I8VUM9_9ANNE|nr:DgyrCDS8611 [Dimorphilus gyrociliatus]
MLILATPPKPKPKPNVKTGVTCEHKVLKLACPAGRKIAVRRAVYGRGKGDMKCVSSKKSLSQVRKFCNGKRRCNVLAKNNVFGDPCPGIFKYLRVAYVCKKVLATPPKPKPKPNVKTGVTCEHKVLKLACPAGRKIAVRRAVYGRGKGDMKCVCFQKSLSQVRKFCNGKRRCNVLAKNNVFGDPCPGIFKYLRVAYVCKKVLATPPKPKPKPNVKTGVTCEHKVLKLACPAGRKIAVRRAVYGRGKGDMKVCPQKSLSKFQKRIAASVCASKKSLSQVRKFCNGKRRCNVLAKNNVFGDPCPGIFKYLRVAYVCKKDVKTGVTCEHKVLKLACPAGRKIAVRRAVYGRGKGDMKVCPQKSLSKFQKRIAASVCASKKSLSQVRKFCNGKRRCNVLAKNNVFGDPCPGIFKYLRVAYVCKKVLATPPKPKPKPNVKTGVTIAASVCASKKSLSQVRKFCNGKRRCNVLAKNNVFGDPCPGIFKYLRVAYVCKKVLATPPKPKPKPNVKTGVTCEHKVLKLACPAGRKIAVRRAVYGRGKGDMKVCPQKSLSKFQKRIAASVCASKKSLSQVRKFCNGKRRCNVLAKNNVFGDPCPGIFKYLRVAYVCKKVLATPPKPKPKPNVKTGVTCEHKVLKLACPAGRKIAVRRAVYGRGKGDMKVCPQKSLSKFQKRIATSVCASKKSLSQVRKFCNGKRRCNVLAKNNVFGDPCPGIFKYLRVAYVCKKVLATPPKPKPKPNVKTGVTCEHKVLKLACPAGRKIAVRRAVYGRGKGDMKVCPQKSLSKFQKRIAASVCASKKSLSQVRKFCNGKRRCNVLAKNNVFGDPCPGIFKYLRVAYVCKKVLATPPKPKPKPNVKTGVTCEHKVLKLACPAGRKIAVRRAVYGRGKGDMKKSLSQVRKFCNGKRRCNVLAKNNVFGDPCPGIFKYLRVAYVCKKVLATPPKPKPKPNVKTGVTCEHKVLKLACPAGRKIAVRRAVYGRGKGDMKVCPQKSLSKFQKRIAASVCASKKSLSQVRKFCNGKRRCNVLAKNNVFGDPCPGIFKYLRVAYVFLATPPKPKPKPNVKTGVTCEHKVLKLACPAGRKIAVRRAVYGRGKGDMKVCPQKSLSKFQKRIAASVCASKKSLSQVRKFCNGKRRCNVLAKNNVFGDPCPGIFKYLRVAYVCKKVLATPPKPKPKPNVKTGVTCEHKVLKLACPAGRKIAVRRAVYGRGKGDMKKSLSQVRKFCNGKRRCNVLAKNNVFGDPCPGIFKYLRVAYVCKKVLATPPKPKPKPNVKTGVTCEHKVLKLACPAGRKIAVRRAVYGRGKGDMKVCPQKSLSKFQKRIAASVCASKKSLSQVRKFCNGKRRCNVLAKNNVFGDPCPGIFKYLRVAYVCKKVLATPPKPKPKPNVKTGVTCEHKVLKLACPAGRKIAVRRAVYGRGKGDMKVCPQKSLSKFQKRIAASVCASKKSLSQVRKFCNGKRRCNVLAKNNVFGDPCPGIFKYLRVAYVCKKVLATPPKPKPKPNVKTGVTCEHKVLKLACPAGRKIAVRRAVYGRGKGDMKVCPQKSLSKFQKRIAASVCASKKSLSQVRKFCNGKRRCNVLAKNNVFGDPCPGIFKYLRVVYFCRKVTKAKTTVKPTSKPVTDGTDATLLATEAPKSTEVFIEPPKPTNEPIVIPTEEPGLTKGSTEGIEPTESDTESPEITESPTEVFEPTEASTEESEATEGSTAVPEPTEAPSELPTEGPEPTELPSTETPTIETVPPTNDGSSDYEKKKTCEHKTLDILCPSGLVIDVKSALYGRSQGDMSSCKKKSLTGYRQTIMNNNCASENSNAIVKRQCNGKSSCSVLAKNSVFGDPCPGIFKYLEVEYKCKPQRPCKKGQFKFGSKCIEVVQNPQFPSEALKYCEERGGQMVSIRNMRKNSAIAKKMLKKSVANGFIGLSDSLEEGKFVWSDGRELKRNSFKFFQNKTGNTIDKDCVYMDSETGRWHHVSCELALPFICEFQIEKSKTFSSRSDTFTLFYTLLASLNWVLDCANSWCHVRAMSFSIPVM